MAIITEDYVSFETAKLLKEKGFDKSTICRYASEGGIWEEGYLIEPPMEPKDQYEIIGNTISAPTLQMAMKWLREVHNIVIMVSPSLFWGKYNASIYKKGDIYPIGFYGGSLVPYYEEACEAAIKYCLENLI